jgi:hypothetical protein
MVAERYDISACLTLGDHRLPRVSESANEDVRRLDVRIKEL